LGGISRAGALAALGDAALLRLSPLFAADAEVTPQMVQLRPEIEPLVRLIENTPREKCFEMMARELRGGRSYREFLAALFLAGIRNVNPQPPGFKFHCVFAIHSAHQLSLDAPAEEGLLPLFWALDYFKQSERRDIDEGDFHLGPVRGALPAAENAWKEFRAAMDAWDEERADRAIAALVRTKGSREIIEGLWRYGARDYRNIGHKAIFAANSWRTLETIGWQHAEPVMRSLVLGMLDFGLKEKVNGYAFEDQCYLANAALAQASAAKLPGDWAAAAAGESEATGHLLAEIREGKPAEASADAANLLLKGKVKAQAVWDAVHLAAGELMMRVPGILGVHTVTSVNALHYAFRVSGDSETRLLLLLQGVGWMSQFAHVMAARNDYGNADITKLDGNEIAAKPGEAAQEILALVSSKPAEAAAKAFQYARDFSDPADFQRSAQSLIFTKGRDAHDYKYSAAIFEDYGLVAPAWRPHMLATAVYYMRGSDLADSEVMKRAREAARGLPA
jgi:hypothetical protein